jgi:hypothetical protein
MKEKFWIQGKLGSWHEGRSSDFRQQGTKNGQENSTRDRNSIVWSMEWIGKYSRGNCWKEFGKKCGYITDRFLSGFKVLFDGGKVLKDCKRGGFLMKNRFLIVILAFAVMVTPIIAFAADDKAGQPAGEVLILPQCLQLAYQNSKQLQSQEKSVVIAKETVRSAEAGLFPTVGYELGAAKYQTEQKSIGSDHGSSGTVSVTQNLYTGGQVTNGVKLAKLALKKTLEDQRKAKQQLTYDVKSAYYQAWLAKKAVDVQQSSYDNLNRHYQQVKVFFQAGTKSRYDLLQAEVNYQINLCWLN